MKEISRLLSYFLISITALDLQGSYKGRAFAEHLRKGIPWAEESIGSRRKPVSLGGVKGYHKDACSDTVIQDIKTLHCSNMWRSSESEWCKS